MVKQWKKDKVKKLKEELGKAKVVGLLDLGSLPSKQLQNIKKSLKGKAELRITKKNIIQRALKGEEQEKLLETQSRMPSLIFTGEDPFKLFKTLKKSESDAYAKPGQETPIDVVVKAGATEFGPGPMLSEFGALGVKTKLEKGKITVLNDAVILKKGEVITPQVASLMQKLDIRPIRIGLNLLAACENGTIFLKDVLDVDEEEFKQRLGQAWQHAYNLSVEAIIFTEDNVEVFLNQASTHAKNLGMEAIIYNKELIGEQLLKAHNQATNLR